MSNMMPRTAPDLPALEVEDVSDEDNDDDAVDAIEVRCVHEGDDFMPTPVTATVISLPRLPRKP